jgi:hypothetical protein
MFLGRSARKLPYIMKGDNGADLKHEMLEARKWDPKDAEQFERKIWSDNAVGMNRDNQMMFEIDDSGARLLEMPDFGPDRRQYGSLDEYSQAVKSWEAGGGKPPGNMVLGDMLDHRELYEQYPNLQALPLKMSILDEGHLGSLNTTGDRLDYMTVNRRLAEGDMLDTILHETQHGIQTQEGWTKGTSPDVTHYAVRAIEREYNKTAQLAYLNGLIRTGMDNDGALAKLIETMPEARSLSMNDIGQLFHDAHSMSPDEIRALRDKVYEKAQHYPDAHSVYERNEGEVMARNTSNRRELTMPERYQSFWRESEDRQGEPRFVGSEGRIEW